MLHAHYVEPGLLDELKRRVEAAEAKFESANLDLRLTELEAAKKRQVSHLKISLSIRMIVLDLSLKL